MDIGKKNDSSRTIISVSQSTYCAFNRRYFIVYSGVKISLEKKSGYNINTVSHKVDTKTCYLSEISKFEVSSIGLRDTV